MANIWRSILAWGTFACVGLSSIHADIYRTDGTLIPGTSNITPGPGLRFDDFDLERADLSNLDLSGSFFKFTNLTNATFANSNLSGGSFDCHNTLTGADFTNTIVDNLSYLGAISAEQLYSTANYQRGDLSGIRFSEEECATDLSGWDLTGQNLSNAILESAHMDRAVFVNANLDQAQFYNGSRARNANFENAQFTNVDINGSSFRGANFAGATLRGTTAYFAGFENANFRGVNLAGFGISDSTAAGADFSGASLSGSGIGYSSVAGADFTNANLSRASLSYVMGFTQEQLYSSASYAEKDLNGFRLSVFPTPLDSQFSETDLSGQNLENSHLELLNLTDSSMTNANFRSAVLSFLDLTNVNALGIDLRVATIEGGTLDGTDLRGARLELADVSQNDLNPALFDQTTTYDQWTAFPEGFDPQAAGLTLVMSPIGDLDANGAVDVEDLDILACRIGDCRRGVVASVQRRSEAQENASDFDSDDRLTRNDLEQFITVIRPTWPGDVDLENGFDSSDLVTVFQAGHYEDDVRINSKWTTGDWNADGEFDSKDIMFAFDAGGYNQGPRPSAAAVPEPSLAQSLLVGMLAFLVGAKRHCTSDRSRRHSK